MTQRNDHSMLVVVTVKNRKNRFTHFKTACGESGREPRVGKVGSFNLKEMLRINLDNDYHKPVSVAVNGDRVSSGE